MNKGYVKLLFITAFIIASTNLLSACVKSTAIKPNVASSKKNTHQVNQTSDLPAENARQVLTGTWQVEFIKERPVIDRSPAQFIFLDKNSLSGSATCNNISSSYNLDDSQKILAFNPVALTRKMCPAALMEQESRFLSALSQVNHYQITIDQNKHSMLYLFDVHNALMFKATRVK